MLVELKEKYEQLTKTNLRITIGLITPIVYPENAIHFDSILTHLVAEGLFPHHIDRWSQTDKQEDIPLPLAKHKGKEHTVWKASVAYIQGMSKEGRGMWGKRTFSEFSGYQVGGIVWGKGIISDEATKSIRSKVTIEKPTAPVNDSASGGFKSFYEHRNIIAAESLIFHVVGNKKEIEKLLENLLYIGKKTAIGYGEIASIEVDEVEHDYSLLDPGGNVARVLPLQDFEENAININASPVKPPYWHNDRIVCALPPSTLPTWEWGDELEDDFAKYEEFDETDYWLDD